MDCSRRKETASGGRRLLQEEGGCSRKKGTAPGGRGPLQEEEGCSRRSGLLQKQGIVPGGRGLLQEERDCSRSKKTASSGRDYFLKIMCLKRKEISLACKRTAEEEDYC